MDHKNLHQKFLIPSSNLVSTLRATALPVTLSSALLLSLTANAADCTKLIISGHTCESLSVKVDSSQCGEGGGVKPAQISECTAKGATVTSNAGDWIYKGKLSGMPWGGKVVFTAEGPVEQTQAKVEAPSVAKVAKAELQAEIKSAAPVDEWNISSPRKREVAQAVVATPSPTPSATPSAQSSSDSGAPTPTPFVPSIKFAGDLRFRHEWVGADKSSTANSYHQQRIRARVGAVATVGSDTQIEVRFATGPGRTSTNQTLGAGSTTSGPGSALANYDIKLDRAAFNWKAFDGLALTGGRTANPFFAPISSDLIWDADLNFDGLSLLGEAKLGNVGLFATAGSYWVDSTTAIGREDVMINSGQIGAKYKANSKFGISLGVALHKYSNTVGHLTFDEKSNGNTVTGSSPNYLYANGYNLLNPGLEVSTEVANLPLTIGVDFVSNTEVGKQKSGYLAGFKLNKLKKQGDWMLSYDYRNLEADAAVSAFTDADSFLGGTNGRSHRVVATYQVRDSWSFGMTGLIGETKIGPGQSPEARNKVQADLNFKF